MYLKTLFICIFLLFFSDFLMTVLRDALQKIPRLKLILMSATLDSELFLSYFDKSCHVQVPGRMYPVDEVYLEDILLSVDYKFQNKVFQNTNGIN